MIYFIFMLFIFLNLFFKKSKLLYFVDFLLMFVLLGYQYGAYDTMIYINRYVHPEVYSSFTEPLFTMILAAFKLIGFSYRNFMLITSLIELILIFRFIKKHTDNHCFVIGLFMIFPMISTFEQLRFFMAFTIILCGAIDALITKSKYYRLKAVIFILIASLIHSSSIFYLLFVLVDFLNVKKTIIISLLTSVLFLTIGFSPKVASLLTKLIGVEKTNIIEKLSILQTGQFGCSFLAFFVIISFIAFYMYIVKKNIVKNYSKDIQEYLLLTLKINIVSLISISLIWIFSVAFMRIATSILILNYVGLSKILILDKKLKIYYIELFAIGCSILLLMFNVHTPEAFNLIVRPFFEENVFFNSIFNS